jgi:predicted nucleotidyltransferase
MRLTNKEQSAIKESFLEVFKNGEIYLFGSRTDDKKRGGDIDLYLIPEKKENLMQKKINFLVSLKRKIGLQKIDVVFNYDTNREIEKEAIKNGILLLKSLSKI